MNQNQDLGSDSSSKLHNISNQASGLSRPVFSWIGALSFAFLLAIPSAAGCGGCDDPDACEGVECNEPPAAECADGSTLRTYEAPGTCVDGECEYQHQDQTCDFGCEDGACLPDPACEGVDCSVAPDPECIDATTLRTYESPGTCVDGECEFVYQDEECALGCADGACLLTDPCEGVDCLDIPDPECVNEWVLRTYDDEPGTCVDGDCYYAYEDLLCNNGCADAQCAPDYTEVECAFTMPVVEEGRCLTTAGEGDHLLIHGRILAGTTVYKDGGVLVDRTTGRITCVGCDCEASTEATGATTIACPDGVVSPGLINPHDHITWALWAPAGPGDPNHRYNHRHDWRTGARGNPSISYPSARNTRNAVLYGELRMLIGGATSIAGSISNIDASGLLRNLDNENHTEGLTDVNVDYRTFPLGDVGGQMRTGGDCSYPNLDNPNRINRPIYMPHVAEGIDWEAQNEFHCLSTDDGIPMLASNTSLVHAIGMTMEDMGRVAMAGAKVIWSPRSNISLYGHTTPVTVYHRLGVTVALSTDWTISGSMNMLRELACADFYNREYLNGFFTERELWDMTTYAAAASMGSEMHIGRLAEGLFADITIFDGPGQDPYRAVIDADVDEVVLVLRAADPLYGDKALIEALVPAVEIAGCEEVDICGIDRRVCLQRDANVTLAQLMAETANPYPLYFCNELPLNEPTCHPSRPGEFTGIPSAGDSVGDGIPDVDDLCSGMFSPIRPLDDGVQADWDGDGVGDFCDPCPFNPDLTCVWIDPTDFTGDGFSNEESICPFHYDPDQVDTTGDGFGDACDPCPGVYSPDGAPCPMTIQVIRDPSHPDHPAENQRVRVYDMVVTALKHNGFFMQDPEATEPDFSAIFVFTSDAPTVAVGDLVHVAGRFRYYFGHAQLDWADIEVLGTVDVPEPFVMDPSDIATTEGGGDAERERTLRWQSALLVVEDVEITQENADEGSDYGEFRVTGGLRINNDIYDYNDPTDIRVLGTQFSRIVGMLQYSWENTKLEPRSAEDMVFSE